MTDLRSWLRTRPDLLAFIALYAMLFVAFGLVSPFFPAFLLSRGVRPEEIGLLLSLAGLVSLASAPIAGRLADRLHALRTVLAACVFGAGLLALAFLPTSGFPILLAISIAHAAVLAPSTSIADALAIRNAAPADKARPRYEYGWIRGSGSAAFVLGSLLAGQMLLALPLSSLFMAHALALTGGAAAAMLAPDVAPQSRPDSPHARNEAPALAVLYANRPYRWLIATAAIILCTHAMHDSFAMIAWNAAGISPRVASFIWSEQVVSEVAVFSLLGPLLLRKMEPVHAIYICAGAAVLRWTAMGLTSSALALSFLEPLHGLTFALLHLACMRILARITPASLAGTAQTVYALGAGAASSLLTFVSGFLYADVGTNGFFVMAGIAAASLPSILALSRALRAP